MAKAIMKNPSRRFQFGDRIREMYKGEKPRANWVRVTLLFREWLRLSDLVSLFRLSTKHANRHGETFCNDSLLTFRSLQICACRAASSTVYHCQRQTNHRYDCLNFSVCGTGLIVCSKRSSEAKKRRKNVWAWVWLCTKLILCSTVINVDMIVCKVNSMLYSYYLVCQKSQDPLFNACTACISKTKKEVYLVWRL